MAIKPQLLPVYLDNPAGITDADGAGCRRTRHDRTAYRMLEGFRSSAIPIVIVTSESGTVSM